MTTRAPILFCDDGSEIELPVRWIICSQCQGHGRSSAHLGAFTQSDIDELGPDFLESYMSGGYDRACDPCDGTGKVAIADFSRMTRQQRTDYRAQMRTTRETDAIEAAERRMGA